MSRCSTDPPAISHLDSALRDVRRALAAVDRHRGTAAVNAEGGDAGHHASAALLVRHTVNYLLAAEIADTVGHAGPLLDVGSGVGAFSSWLADRTGRPLHLADHDADVRALARRAFPDAVVHADVSAAPPAAVVSAMEVIEHLPYRAQVSFVRALWDRVMPGGTLVCSTPDERGYLGGWSGYAPHIGTLDAGGVRSLLQIATGHPAQVWRVDGPGFRLGPGQRVVEPLANHVWTVAQRRAPRLTTRLVDAVGSRRRRSGHGPRAPADTAFTVAESTHGDEVRAVGTGLVAAVHRPTR